MKCICDMCNGTGYVKEASNSMDYPYVKKCPKCRGGGYKVEQGQTNEEWFDGLSTEEKATFLVSNKMLNFDYQMWIEWLKEIHDGM